MGTATDSTVQALLTEPHYRGPTAFFRRHWNGDYSLARSYWLNTFLVTLVAPVLGVLLLPWLAANVPSRYASVGVLVITAIGVGVWCWAVSGTWASANKHVSRGGQPVWAFLAKLMICFGALKIFGDLYARAPAFSEHARIAAGGQLGEDTSIELRADGRSILLSGGINDGSAEMLDKALSAAPSVTTVVFASNGGWIREGKLLAEVVRRRHLNTYVEGTCASACTMAFLAGVERAADPRAKIGFHTSRGVGSLADQPAPQETTELEAFYRSAGLPPAFIARAISTPHATMWFPTTDELVAAKVLTRRSEGGETAALATRVKSREAMVADLKKVGVFAALAERSPGDFDRMVDAGWNKVQAGASDAIVITAARQELTALVPRLLPLVSDATLIDFQQLAQRQLEALQKSAPHLCVEMLFPSGKAVNFSANLPQELVNNELELTERVIRDADSARAIHPAAQAKERVAARAARGLSQAERTAFADEATRVSSPPAVVCGAGIKFMASLNAIPLTERATSLRTLYSGN